MLLIVTNCSGMGYFVGRVSLIGSVFGRLSTVSKVVIHCPFCENRDLNFL